ncbi:MAG: hypothetical protein JXA58_02465 [Dehalococcoidia bacterium]|nr:hypothetical protein [Dehalococcoidia bacterium]
MRHVLGVAYPYLDCLGAHSTELELGLLRLAFTVANLRSAGESAGGYIVVLRQEIRDAVRKMKGRYDIGEEVQVVFASLLISDMTRLDEAAEKWASGEGPTEAIVVARDIALAALEREVASSEPGVCAVVEHHLLPFGIPWDYYGVVVPVEESTGGDSSRPKLF